MNDVRRRAGQFGDQVRIGEFPIDDAGQRVGALLRSELLLKRWARVRAIIDVRAGVERHDVGVVGFLFSDQQPRLAAAAAKSLQQRRGDPLGAAADIAGVHRDDLGLRTMQFSVSMLRLINPHERRFR